MLHIKFNRINILILSLILFFNLKSLSQEINCLDCHENLIAKTVHDKIIKCGDCHKNIINAEHKKGDAKFVNCGSCHTQFAKEITKDIHHKLKNTDESKVPNCILCHGSHKIQSPGTVQNKEKHYCGKCHKESVLGAPFHTLNKVNDNCIICHKEKNYKSDIAKSIHTKLSCSNCHSYVVNDIENHEKAPKGGPTADCYLCHNTISAIHKESIHGLSIAEGINEAAQCWDCHGSHSITKVADKKSKVYPSNLVATCGKCHDNPDFTKKHSFAVKKPGKMYSQSVHGKLVKEDKINAASCVTCHGSHDIKNRVQAGSKITSINIPNTCAECHKKITEEYKQSIHWIAVKKGVRESPSCNDCHSEHSIHAINTLNKREEIKKIQSTTCLQCHQNLLLSERYGMTNLNGSSYQDSYHGRAVSRGDNKAAMCVDCHEVHKILPKSHKESSINKNNVVATCKKCHPKASDVFSQSYSHVSNSSTSAKYIEDIVATIYLWVIIIVIGGMILHNLLIAIHEFRIRYRKSKNEIRVPRFTKNELIQHIVLLTSFIILAITGFLLKYPNSWWGKGLYLIGIDETVRQVVHRVAAAIMIILSCYHVIYLVITARGRDVVKGLFPNPSDIRQAINNILYYMHLRKRHPDFDNYNYIEKMEYWALIWGTIVMGVTGFVLWFPTIVGTWAPTWFIKVSEIVHFYEAILATLAIVVWHWFFVIFHPREYPVSLTCINGKMSVAHYKEEHRLKFYKVIAEWFEIQNRKINVKKQSNFTKLFISTIEKHGLKFDDFVISEIENDENLKKYLQEKGLLEK